jgi:hypothetical protein
MGRTFLWLATEMMVKFSSNAEGVKRRGFWRELEWIQEDTEPDHSQREYEKNVVVVGNRGMIQEKDARE